MGVLEPLPDEQLDGLLEPIREGHPAWNRIPDEVKDQVIEDILKTGSIVKTAEKFGLNRATVGAIVREFRSEVGKLVDFRYQTRIEKVLDKLLQRLENETGEVKTGQLPVTIAILLDKRRELRGKTLNAQGPLNLRVAWRDGSGAVELSTGTGQGE